MNISSSEPIRVCIAGDTYVGKSCLHAAIVNDTTCGDVNDSNAFKSTYGPTIGVDFGVHHITSSSKIFFWDLGGQDSFRDICASYLRISQIHMLCYDVTNRRSFDVLEQVWIQPFRKVSSPLGQTPKYIILGLKADLLGAQARQVTTEEGQQLAKKWNAQFAEISAKTYPPSQVSIFIERLVLNVANRTFFGKPNLPGSVRLPPPTTTTAGDEPKTVLPIKRRPFAGSIFARKFL